MNIIQAPMVQVVSVLAVVQVFEVAGSNPNRRQKSFFSYALWGLFRVSIRVSL